MCYFTREWNRIANCTSAPYPNSVLFKKIKPKEIPSNVIGYIKPGNNSSINCNQDFGYEIGVTTNRERMGDVMRGTRLTKEALLRQLLDVKSQPDEKTIYAYILGYRLFQSSEQLLKELQLRINGKESAEIDPPILRRSRKPNPRSQGSACMRCKRKQEHPKMMSQSTTNILDRDNTSYVEMLRANVMIQATGRLRLRESTATGMQILSSCGSSDSVTISPARSCDVSRETLVKSTDFDDLYGIDSLVFDESNRRNTAPPAAMQALPSPQHIERYARSTDKPTGTDFSTNKGKTSFVSKASLEILLEKLPETNIDDVQVADGVTTSGVGVVPSGEDTIRRRKKGRRRTTFTDLELMGAVPVSESLKIPGDAITDRRSVVSQDSGILSGVLDHDVDLLLHNNNNNNMKMDDPSEFKQGSTSSSSSHSPKDSEDSGFISQTSSSGTDTLEQLSKDIKAQIFSHLGDESVVPNDDHERQRQLIHVLLIWVRNFPLDFRSNQTLETLEVLLNSLGKDSPALTDQCTEVLDTLRRSTAHKSACKKLLSQSDALATGDDFGDTKEAMIAMVTGMSDVGDAYKMAEQLCLIEMDLLSPLGAEEFLQMFNSRDDDDVETNLGACVRWFNHLSHLVATTICLCRKPKHRRHVISLFTRSASRCYEMSNFNSAIAILTGLSLGAVARLKRTWSKMDSKEMDQLQNVFDPSNNFRRYRSMFNSRWAAMRRQQNAKPPSPPPENNRYSSASQHSVRSRLSIVSVTSQHRDSGIECENDSATSSKSPVTTSPTSSTTRKFTFDDVTSRTGIEDGVLVPFLTLLVKDVYFLNHSTPTIENDGTINFEKLRHLGEMLRPLETWKNAPCVYEKNEKLQDFLQKSSVLKDSELYNLSYKREPPRNKFEKNQLKAIKAEVEYSKRGSMVRRMIQRRKTM